MDCGDSVKVLNANQWGAMITRHKPTVVFAFALVTLFTVTYAFAYGFGFLRNEAVSAFNDEDLALMDQAINYTLDEKPDQEIHTWSNPKTGNGGAITPLESFEQESKPCRRIRIINRSRHHEGRSTFTFCKKEDGTWLVKPRGTGGPRIPDEPFPTN